MPTVCERLQNDVIEAGICTGCGACVALDQSCKAVMRDTPWGPCPSFEALSCDLPDLACEACPGKGYDFIKLYNTHYGHLPENWLLGCFQKVRTGYSSIPEIRRGGASGGVISHTLVYLLENKLIDAAIIVQQGTPEPLLARAKLVRTSREILDTAQSIYIPVSTLDILRSLVPGERYAITCLPDQAAALRLLQQNGFEPAKQVKYVLGPYTGTALYPAAIECYLRGRGVKPDDKVVSLKWRAGEWPGYMEIRMASGKVFQSKKVYYNFLIPFFITRNSLQNMDFTNEFCDLSVGDAWSPRFEKLGGGYSVITTRSAEMESIISAMEKASLLVTTEEDPFKTLEMHGHMLDFKKRGGYIRNHWRRAFGKKAPRYGIRPVPLPVSRYLVEVVISSIFLVCGTRLARKILECLPESFMGPMFDKLRLTWKRFSKPVKRKGLGTLLMEQESVND